MNENLSVLDVLKITIDLLGRIKVPVGLMNDISAPINDARNNLMACVDAIEKEEKSDG